MPSWPIEMPSETEIVPNSKREAAARRARRSSRPWRAGRGERLQGVISFQLDATPICGFSQSSSPMPTARSIPRAAVASRPSVTARLRGLMSGPSAPSAHACRLVGAAAATLRGVSSRSPRSVRPPRRERARPPVARRGTAPRRRAGAARDGRPACRAATVRSASRTATRRGTGPPGPHPPRSVRATRTPRPTSSPATVRGTHQPVARRSTCAGKRLPPWVRAPSARIGPTSLPSSSWNRDPQPRASRSSRSHHRHPRARSPGLPARHHRLRHAEERRQPALRHVQDPPDPPDQSRDPAVERAHEPVVPLGLRPVRQAVPGRPVDVRRPAPASSSSPPLTRSTVAHASRTGTHGRCAPRTPSAPAGTRPPARRSLRQPWHPQTAVAAQPVDVWWPSPATPASGRPDRRPLPAALARESLRDSRQVAAGGTPVSRRP